jgi:hypothetical protein
MSTFVSGLVVPRSAESSDNYPVLARLNSRWRVIACRDGIQWILQYRNRAETVARDGWRGRSYCRTKEALIRVCDAHAGDIDPNAAAILACLPEWFPEEQYAPARNSRRASTDRAQPVDYSKFAINAGVAVTDVGSSGSPPTAGRK